MNETQRHRRISAILEVVVDAKLTERDELIHEQCEGDQDLILEVKTLLKQDDTDTTILDTPLYLADIVLDKNAEQLGLGEVRIPGFELKGVLGQGMSSIVYRARQQVPDREVAVKVLRPLSCTKHAESRIRAEAHLLARLEHPSIARIHHFGVIESSLHSQPYLVMELADGQPLPAYLKEHELSFKERMKLVVDLCEIFEYAHKQGVVHRDIKPSNIMIHFDAERDAHVPMIIDFGIAKLIHGQPIPIDIQTLHPEAFGTLRYMSPERLEGKSSGDTVTSDIYSLGVVASELLGSQTVQHPLLKQREPEYVGEDMTEAISRVLLTMTNTNPDQRYRSVAEASKALQGAVDQKPLFLTSLKVRPVLLIVAALMVSVYFGSKQYTPTRESIQLPSRPTYSNGIDVPISPSGFDQESEQAILRGRFLLIGNRTTNGLLSEAHRMIQMTEEEYPTIDSIPENLQLTYIMSKGYTQLKSGMLEEATASYYLARDYIELTDELHHHIANSWRGIAHGIQSCGDHETARVMYDELINHPGFNRVRWDIRSNTLACSAGLYWLNGELDTAVTMFRRIVETAPTPKTKREHESLAQHQSSLGVVLMTMGKFDEAEPHFKMASDRAVTMNGPSDPFVCRMYRNLATNYLLQEKYANCESVMLSIRGVWSSMPETWDYEIVEADFLLGSAHLGLNKPELALKHLKEAQAGGLLVPEFKMSRLTCRINNALGEALFVTGSQSEGRAMLDASEIELNETFPEGSPWIQLAVDRSERFQPNN